MNFLSTLLAGRLYHLNWHRFLSRFARCSDDLPDRGCNFHITVAILYQQGPDLAERS